MIGGYLGGRPNLTCLWHALSRAVWGHAPPGNFEKLMHTLGDAFSLAFSTDFYLVTGNKVMMNWTVDIHDRRTKWSVYNLFSSGKTAMKV